MQSSVGERIFDKNFDAHHEHEACDEEFICFYYIVATLNEQNRIEKSDKDAWQMACH